MCWFIDLEIIPKESIKKFNCDFLYALDSKIKFDGTFPVYRLSDGHCLCDYLKNKSNWGLITKLVIDISRNEQVKRVKVLKYWGALPEDPIEMKLSISNFILLDSYGGLEENVWYSVIDESKFNYS